MPSEPEFASIPGTPMSGCPSSPPRRRKRKNRSSGITPNAKSAAYRPGHVVALGREVDVAIGMLPAETRRVQLLEEKPRDDVHRAEARPEVPGAGTLDRDERIEAAHVGSGRQSQIGVVVNGEHAIELGSGDDVELRHRRETLARHTELALRWPTRPAAPKTTSAGATGTANSMIE